MFNFYDNNHVEDNFREWSHSWHSSSQLAELSRLPCESWYKSHIYSAVNNKKYFFKLTNIYLFKLANIFLQIADLSGLPVKVDVNIIFTQLSITQNNCSNWQIYICSNLRIDICSNQQIYFIKDWVVRIRMWKLITLKLKEVFSFHPAVSWYEKLIWIMFLHLSLH